jgi:hypothetical protein
LRPAGLSLSAAVVDCSLPKKKKTQRFRATTAVKSMARDVLGTPPPVQRQENTKRDKKPKHKITLSKLLSDSDR